MRFNKYPFEKLRALLGNTSPRKQGIDLSIGEPGFKAPKSVIDSIKEHAYLVQFYPKLLDELTKAQICFVKQRFGVELDSREMVPTFGSREAIFSLVQYMMQDRKKNVIAFPNPFYQIYEGSAIAARARMIYMPLTESNGFKPSLSKQQLEQVGAVILNSPNNPTGQVLSKAELEHWVRLSMEYDFYVINDECYSEIYIQDKPASILEACIDAGNKEFRNVFAINSISKRLCVPGLRSGFIAGDATLLERYRTYRNYIGISMPLTLQKAAIVAWREHEYADKIRGEFAKNLLAARDIFKHITIFPYTFYLWLKIQNCNEVHLSERLFNDELFARNIYERYGHTIMPGSYMGNNGAGVGYVRIALTKETNEIHTVLSDIKHTLEQFIKKHSCL